MAMRELPQLVWLASFLAVVEHGTFTAAARSTNRAQPRISAHVASLERHLGAVLLERGPRNVRLTSAGEALLPYARGACQQLRSGDRKSTRLNSSHVSISYAVFCLKKKTSQNERW